MTREMKYSGVEWIGDIPREWDIIKAKYIFTNHKEIVGNREKDFERLSLTLNGVLKRPKDDSKGLQSDSLSTYQILYQNELVFKMIDLENTSTSRVGYSPYTGLVSPVYIIFNNKEYSRYGYWYFYNLWQRNIYNTLGNNGVRSALNASDMLGLPFIKMPQYEQKKIANFLDSKVSEIDKIITETKSSIENYKEYKQSVITEAVTKGLDKNVPMKDSGIEWIGDIPTHWNVCKIKHILRQKSERGYPNEVVLSLYRDFGIIPKDSRDDNHNVTSEDTSNYKFVDIGDFVINKMKAWQGSMGISEFRGIISPAYHVCYFIDKNINKKYFHYLLRNKLYLPEFRRLSSGIRLGQWDLSFEDFKNIDCIIPSVLEQQLIVDFLDKKCAEIDNIISEKEKLITSLEEYKKSLVYEYVTGKKAVE